MISGSVLVLCAAGPGIASGQTTLSKLRLGSLGADLRKERGDDVARVDDQARLPEFQAGVGVEGAGGRLPTSDWMLNLHILTSGGYQWGPQTPYHYIGWNVQNLGHK